MDDNWDDCFFYLPLCQPMADIKTILPLRQDAKRRIENMIAGVREWDIS